MTNARHVTVQIVASIDHNLDPDGYVLEGLKAAVRQYEQYKNEYNVQVLRSTGGDEVGMMSIRDIEIEQTEPDPEADKRADEIRRIRAMQEFMNSMIKNKKED